MKNKILKSLKYIVISSSFLVLIGFIFVSFGFVINNTYSMPLGIYKVKEDKQIYKNDLVVFEIPAFNKKLLKKVVATKDDLVLVNETGVYVNGTLLENSKIFQFDSKGQPLKMFPINRVLNQDEIFAMGENIQSYDSRYFGVVNIKESNIKKVDKFLIWSEIK